MSRSLVVSLVVFLATACGSSGGSTPDGAPGDDGGPPDSTPPCTSTEQCTGGQVCDPATGACVDSLPCGGHADCGLAAHCAGGVCTPSMTGSPCDTAASCPSSQECTGGFCGCVGEQFVAEAVPPNVLIVLDRSGSMDSTIGSQTKWEIAKDAIGQLLASYGASVRFGLVLYEGSAGECAPGDLVVDVGPDTATAINSAIANTAPAGFTPIGGTLDALVSYAGLEDATRPNYILLLTDGEETCGGDGLSAVQTLRAQSPEVKTFVVGFGSGVDPAALNDMAVAGGTDLPGDPKYYQADNAAALAAAFDAIGGSVLSCTYTLSDVPTDLGDLYIYFDGSQISRDPSHAGGWDYDAATNQITFYGAECQALKSGQVTDLVIVYGCPNVVARGAAAGCTRR